MEVWFKWFSFSNRWKSQVPFAVNFQIVQTNQKELYTKQSTEERHISRTSKLVCWSKSASGEKRVPALRPGEFLTVIIEWEFISEWFQCSNFYDIVCTDLLKLWMQAQSLLSGGSHLVGASKTPKVPLLEFLHAFNHLLHSRWLASCQSCQKHWYDFSNSQYLLKSADAFQVLVDHNKL